MGPTAFTLTSASITRVLSTPIGYSLPVTNDTTKQKINNYQAIWDTGATASVISKQVVEDLSLTPITMQKINHAQGECYTNVYIIDIYLPNNIRIQNVKVTEGIVNLIGMDIISLGDFALTNRNGQTMFSFQIPSTHMYDFVNQIKHNGNRLKK